MIIRIVIVRSVKMTALSKEIIEKLSKEKDIEVVAEVLDFYEYLKEKK